MSDDPGGGYDEIRDRRLSQASIGKKALSGAALVAGRSIALLGLALVANAVLARQLAPKDFGLIAFGSAVMSFAGALANGGLGSALIRSSAEINAPTLKSVFGLELVVTTALFALIGAVALPFSGLAGRLTVVMALSLPIGSLTTPASIVLERSLSYKTLARVEVLQAVVYYGYAVTVVSLGLGVWGLATAVVVRSVSSVALLFRARPDLFFLPSFSLARVRPLLRFGMNFQATSVATLIRDQGLNVGIAAVAGTSTLGIWTLARRLLELPMQLFQTLWRVSFPATSQLIAAGADARRLIERGAKLTAIGSGLVLAPVSAAAPGFVPAVFGHRWHEAGLIVPIACAALVISGPISVATAGFLYASGDASAVLLITIAHTATWLVTALGLLPFIGVLAVPIGWTLGSAVDAYLLVHYTRRRVDVKLGPAIAWPTGAAEVAGVLGLAYTAFAGETFLNGMLSGAIALAVFLALLMAREGHETMELARATLQTVRRGRPQLDPVGDA